MDSRLAAATLFNGFLLGWSIAWPPGPVNAEIIRRSLAPRPSGGGFWSAWRVGLGACTGEFLWALSVAIGAGALINTRMIRMLLGAISLVLLVFLGCTYAVSAWRTARAGRDSGTVRAAALAKTGQRSIAGGYTLGFMLAITSPWNIGFWLAVIGGQQNGNIGGTLGNSLALASAVVLGAVTWTLVLSFAVKAGARVFARPAWQIGTQLLTAATMLAFAVKLALQFR